MTGDKCYVRIATSLGVGGGGVEFQRTPTKQDLGIS